MQPNDAADIVQDVFQRVLSHLDDFHRCQPGESFRGWVYRIARNRTLDHFRQSKRQPNAVGGSDANDRIQELPQPEVPEEESNECATASRRLVLRQGVELIRNDFDPKTWTAFLRTAVEGHNSAEVAEELGMTKDAVRQAKCRILRRLRKDLAWLP